MDDDEDLRTLARKALIRCGHMVLEAAGGREALEMIEEHHPDVAVLDLLMPEPNGFEVLKILRSREDTAALRVIVLTAQGDEASATASFDLGATDFLQKALHAAAVGSASPVLLRRAAGACKARSEVTAARRGSQATKANAAYQNRISSRPVGPYRSCLIS